MRGPVRREVGDDHRIVHRLRERDREVGVGRAAEAFEDRRGGARDRDGRKGTVDEYKVDRIQNGLVMIEQHNLSYLVHHWVEPEALDRGRIDGEAANEIRESGV